MPYDLHQELCHSLQNLNLVISKHTVFSVGPAILDFNLIMLTLFDFVVAISAHALRVMDHHQCYCSLSGSLVTFKSYLATFESYLATFD